MAPEQVRVMTVSEKSLEWGTEVVAALKLAGVRVAFDDRDDKIGAKIREAHNHKPFYQVVVGERDAENRTVSVKSREADLGALTVEAFVARVVAEAKPPFGS